MRLVSISLLVSLAVGGCGIFGGGKDTAEPPAELQSFETTLRVRKLWSSKVGGESERLRLGLRPATDGARIYAGAHDGQIAAFDAETGRKQWSLKTDLPLAAGPGFGDGLLVFGTTDGELLALDAMSGEELWRTAVGSEVLAAPAVGPNVVVFRSVDGRLRGFASGDGSPLWEVAQTLPALTLRGNTAPYIVGDVVISGFDNGRIGSYDVSSGDVIWEMAIASPTGRNELDRLVDISAGLHVIGNDVYTAGYHGRAVGIDLRSGLLIWQQELSSFSGLGADFSNVYVTNDFDAIIALDRRAGAIVWRQEALRLRDVTAPTRFRQTVVVGDYEGYLHWLDPDDGQFLARERAASARITAAPLVVGLNLFVQTDNGTVAAFEVVDDPG